jgi:cytochrome c-type biogenesis protein CcmH
MQRFIISLLFAGVVIAPAQTPPDQVSPKADSGELANQTALIQGGATAAEKPNADVLRVGKRIRCKCGCGDSAATCEMVGCEYSKSDKERIAKMQSLGMNDQQIVDSFIRDYGADIYLAPPSALGWAVPYAAVGVGMGVIYMFLNKYRKPKPLVEVGTIEIDDPALEKYKDQIEKDLANME